jgi:hypothetical protein
VTARWLAGLAILVLIVAACGGSSASESPSAAPSSAATPAPSPSDDALGSPDQGPPGEIAVGSLATVVTNDLRVRTKPSVSSDSTKLKPLLDQGRVVYVVSGPKKGSGYTWYRVQPLRQDSDRVDMPLGWIAAADKDGTPWLSQEAPPCPGLPGDYASFAHTTGLVALACFRGKEIQFPARLEAPEATCGVDIGWTVEPDWLGSTCPQPKVLVADTATTDSIIPIIDPKVDLGRFSPGVDEADWVPVTIVGHYDHSAAKSCKGKSTDTGTKVPMTRAQLVLGCRATFVITAIEPRS